MSPHQSCHRHCYLKPAHGVPTVDIFQGNLSRKFNLETLCRSGAPHSMHPSGARGTLLLHCLSFKESSERERKRASALRRVCRCTPSLRSPTLSLPSHQDVFSPKGQLLQSQKHPEPLQMHPGRLHWSPAKLPMHHLQRPATCLLHLQTRPPLTPGNRQCCPLMSCRHCCCCCLLRLLSQSRHTPQHCLHAKCST